MEKLYLSKDKSLVNLGNSILKAFGVTPFHETYKTVDEIIKNSRKEKIALILFDGFGVNIAEHYKENIPYIYAHKVESFNSVYPPTTVAATTALTTGTYPIENGHIGWTQHFNEYNADICVFLSTDKFDNKKIYPNVSNILKPKFIWEYINETQKFNADSISSFHFKNKDKTDDFETFFEEADKTIKIHDFTYVYSSNPDHLLHELGCYNETVKENLIYLEGKLKALIENNKDTLFLLVADHGFRDIEEIPLNEHADFFETLSRKYVTYEPSFSGFYVKDGQKFLELANKYYSDKFFIYSKDEILKDHILGYGEMSQYVKETLPDFFLIAKDKYSFYDGEKPVGFKGHHAGGTKEEREIYLYVFNN